MHREKIENQRLELWLLDHDHLVQELQELVLHDVVIEDEGEQVLDQHGTDR